VYDADIGLDIAMSDSHVEDDGFEPALGGISEKVYRTFKSAAVKRSACVMDF